MQTWVKRSPAALSSTRGRGALAMSAIAALVAWIYGPVLTAPFTWDDYIQLRTVQGAYRSSVGPFGLFDYAASRQVVLEQGGYPWWLRSNFSVRFLRPIPSVLAWIDYSLFGENTAAIHAHSLVWLFIGACCVYRLLRWSLTERAALVAAAITLFAPCNAIPLAWASNRSVLVVFAFGVTGLLSYVRLRHRPGSSSWFVSATFFGLAMASGEYALGLMGYVVAIELVDTRSSLRDRAVVASSALVPTATYLVLRWFAGCHATGTTNYSDLSHGVWEFLASATDKAGALFVAAWLGLGKTPAESSAWKTACAFVGIVSILAVAVPSVWRNLDSGRRTAASWLLLGSVLSLLPYFATKPHTRLLVLPMLGVSATVALVIDAAFSASSAVLYRERWRTRLAAAGLAAAHLIMGPASTGRALRAWIDMLRPGEASVAQVRDWARNKAEVTIVRAATMYTLTNLGIELDGSPPPRVRMLSYGEDEGEALLERTGPRSLELISDGAPLIPPEFDSGYEFYGFSIPVQKTVRIGGFRATTLSKRSDGGPLRLRYEYDRDLDDPSELFLVEGPSGFRRLKLPPVGSDERLVN